MRLDTAVTFDDASDAERPDLFRAIATVTVTDADHPEREVLQARFTYLGVGGDRWWLVGVAVEPRPDVAAPDVWVLSVPDVRGLPLNGWEQAARAGVVTEWQAQVGAPVRLWADDVERRARRVADVMPEVGRRKGVLATEGGRHRVDTALKLAQVAEEYRAQVRRGSRSPSLDIAEAWGISPAAARALVHRARRAGFLGPAPGPTAGEAAGHHPNEQEVDR